jgi:glycosyltransferase involved in cell wall biosynthesis
MKLFYATSIRYPSPLANRVQTLAMARALAGKLGQNFFVGGNQITSPDPRLQVVNFGIKKSWKLAWHCARFIRREHITHVYCREARLLFFIVFYNLIFFWQRPVYGYEVHALLGRSKLDWFTDWVLSFFVRYYFFTTAALRQIYSAKYHLSLTQSLVLPDAVDLEIFDIPTSKSEARQQVGWAAADKIVGYTGRFKTLSKDKGLDTILAALVKLPDNIKFVAIGGSAEDILEYQHKAAALRLGERATFLGHVSQSQLAIYQKAFDILLMPFPWETHYAYYMSALKMFEYMAAQRPIIATNLPSVKEILNEHNAVLVAPGQPSELAKAVTELYQDEHRAAQCASAAYHDVQDHTWSKRAGRVIRQLAVDKFIRR